MAKISSCFYFISFAFLLLFVRPNMSRAQNAVTPIGNVLKVDNQLNGVHIKTTHAFVRIRLYQPGIIQVQISKVDTASDFSYAVIGKPDTEKGLFTMSQNSQDIILKADSIILKIQKEPFRIAFLTPENQVINEDEPGLGVSWIGPKVTSYKKMQPGERFIGLGEKTGNLDRKGAAYTNWNEDHFGYSITQDPLYATIPFYMGIQGGHCYGIFLDNSYQTDFNFGASNDRFASFGARGGILNYYFFYKNSPAGILKDYTWLTGRMPMPPLWSLGYQQNRYSYYPQSEVMRIAHTLREKRIPADGITLDIHYMQDYKLFTWNKQRFQDPVQMNEALKALGFKTTVIVDPGIKKEQGYPAYESGKKADIFLKYNDGTPYTAEVWPGWCNFPDFTSEKGRDWWQDQVEFFADSKVDGIWNDMNEISTWGQQMPDNILYNYDNHPTTNMEGHNVFGLEMTRASYLGAVKHMKKRPFILTRSGYAGLQRYTAIWTGDNRSEDDHMLAGVRLLNSLGLSGVSFTGMDVGGFTGNPSTDLYIRWMELGAFIPYFRNHTTFNTKAAEPWTFGEEALGIVRNYINLRYQLLPYIYSSFYRSTQDGMPFMRSLAISYPNDAKVYDPQFQNQFLSGPAFMVAPVESGKDFLKVYLPKGQWYNMYNDLLLEGDTESVTQLSIQQLPIYIKAGSIIPMQSLIQSTAEMPGDTLKIHVYKGQEANSFVYYEDDGSSFDYKNGAFYKRTIRYNPAVHTLSFSKAEGTYSTKFRHIALYLHGFEQMNTLQMNGQSLSVNNTRFSFSVDTAPSAALAVANGPEVTPGSTFPDIAVQMVAFPNDADSITLQFKGKVDK